LSRYGCLLIRKIDLTYYMVGNRWAWDFLWLEARGAWDFLLPKDDLARQLFRVCLLDILKNPKLDVAGSLGLSASKG
jgi:hypothetical protein